MLRRARATFTGDEKNVFSVKHRQNLRLFSTYRLKDHLGTPVPHMRRYYLSKMDFYAGKIFNLLFPENSVKPAGFALKKIEGVVRPGVLSEPIDSGRDRRSDAYKRYQKWYYSPESDVAAKVPDYVREHRKFALTVGYSLAEEMHRKAGITPNQHPVNIVSVVAKTRAGGKGRARGEKGGASGARPVFFEVAHINTEKLMGYVKGLGDPVLEKEITGLLSGYESAKAKFSEHQKAARQRARSS